jgi:uncharacterized protein
MKTPNQRTMKVPQIRKMKSIVICVIPLVFITSSFAPGTIQKKQSFISSICSYSQGKAALYPISFKDIVISGELLQRLYANFNRLEEEKYQPQNVFLTDVQSGGWPGDTEGRTILGLVLDAQASHRNPKYLKNIIDKLPEKMNERGYLGTIYPLGTLNEQQLSGHGWLLRGLCEYYLWTKDAKVLEMICKIIDNLVLPSSGHHRNYPIDPLQRTHTGGYAGTDQGKLNEWIVSSDIGCDFIFMDGVIQAYTLVPSPELKVVIDEMVDRFLQIDLIAIKAQTHATLTALRGLLRLYEISGQADLLDAVEKRFLLYKQNAMTENYENYNWFGRGEWTEPCAVIDSYIVAFSLWRLTGKTEYLEDAHLIYFNGMNHEQRYNGGFGCNTCSGAKQSPYLSISVNEAHWCCTMRGGEGLSRAAQYSVVSNEGEIVIPFYNDCEFTVNQENGKVTMRESTTYPHSGKVTFSIINSNLTNKFILKLFTPSWAENFTLFINGKKIPIEIKNGFINVKHIFKTNDTISLTFVEKLQPPKTFNLNSIKGRKFFYGPLLLGYDGKDLLNLGPNYVLEKSDGEIFKFKGKDIKLTPVYHLMNAKVWQENEYKKQVVF